MRIGIARARRADREVPTNLREKMAVSSTRISGQGEGTRFRWALGSRARDRRVEPIWSPRDVDDLVEIVAHARSERTRIRALGASYPCSPSIPRDSCLVDLRRFDRVELDLRDPNRPLAIVGAGATGRALDRVLESAGFSLSSNIGPNSTWGCMIAFGAHGSGWDEPTLADRVHAIELVDGRGRPRRFERGRDLDEVMSAVGLALGSFGLVHRIELRIAPAFDVRLVDDELDVHELMARLPELVPAHAYFDISWRPGSRTAWVRTWDRVDVPASHRSSTALWSRCWDWMLHGHEFRRRQDRIVHIHEAARQRAGIEVGHAIGCVEFGFSIDDDFDRVRAAWRVTEEAAARWAARGRHPINSRVNLRFMGGSDCLLSAAHGNAHTCFVEVLGDATSPEWLLVVDELALAWMDVVPNARPHWPKQHEEIPGIAYSLRTSLGNRLERFKAARARLDVDPDGLFRNTYLDRMLFGPI